jgi:nicotinate-nucleotide adenylyltransferase
MIKLASKKEALTQEKISGKSYQCAGLFGGTFDPIHRGHLQVARDVKKHFSLDKIIFIPSAQPPHKPSKIIADAADRIEMTQLAVSMCPDFVISDIELKRSGPSYTIDTISYFKEFFPKDTRLYFILGFDAFLELDTWKSYKALFDHITFIVMRRPGFGYQSEIENLKIIHTYLKTKISEDYSLSISGLSCIHKDKYPVYLCHVTPVDISSTQIRDLIRKGASIHSLVTENVEQYIKTQGLYR